MSKDKYKEHSDGSIFKIWSKKLKRYLSTSNSVTSWRSLHWVAQKLLDIKKWDQDYFDPNNYEVHKFEVVFSQEVDINEIINNEQGRRNKKEYAEKRIKELSPLIMQYFSGVNSIDTVLRIYDSGMLKETFISEIDPLIKEYRECEKIIG